MGWCSREDVDRELGPAPGYRQSKVSAERQEKLNDRLENRRILQHINLDDLQQLVLIFMLPLSFHISYV